MEPKRYWVAAALVLVFMVSLGGNVSAYNMAEYYPLNQGDVRSYSYNLTVVGGEYDGLNISYPMKQVVNGTEVVNEVETMKVEYQSAFAPTVDYVCVGMDSEGFKWYKRHRPSIGMDLIYEPFNIIFPAQLDLGEVYQNTFSWSAYSTADSSLMLTSDPGTLTITLEVVEDVTVPGGTFENCLKVVGTGSWQASGGTGIYGVSCTSWYAQGIGRVKWVFVEDFSDPVEEDYAATNTWELKSATVGGVHYGCPAMVAIRGEARENNLNSLRQFRDEVLAKDMAGIRLVELYYKYAPEVSNLLLKDADLRSRTTACLEKLIPELTLILEGDTMLLSKEMGKEIGALLNAYAENASPGLRQVIERLQEDVRGGTFLKSLGVTFEE